LQVAQADYFVCSLHQLLILSEHDVRGLVELNVCDEGVFLVVNGLGGYGVYVDEIYAECVHVRVKSYGLKYGYITVQLYEPFLCVLYAAQSVHCKHAVLRVFEDKLYVSTNSAVTDVLPSGQNAI
jgi:hypothetical protein